MPKKILIVDDEPSITQLLRLNLDKTGHYTLRTENVAERVLSAVQEFKPELILLDVMMPGMDGFEVARQIRAMPLLSGAFVVAMSGYGRSQDLAEAKAAGFDEYLVKPVDLAQLREWLATRTAG